MAPNLNLYSARVVGLIDVGTNSARLMVVRLNPNMSYTIINQHKVMVRLGEGEFLKGRLQPEAIDRTVLVLKRFVEMARNLGAEDFWAVATSATRDAENRQVFLERVWEEAGLDLKVISGLEEARLIYLGVSSGFHLGDKTALFIDIGGGSTETILGNQFEFFSLDSMKLGAIRLKNMFLGEDTGEVSAERYSILRQHVRNSALRTIQRVKKEEIHLTFGSSGTIENLYDIAQKNFPGKKKDPQPDTEAMTIKEVEHTIQMMCSMSLSERTRIPGMNPERADIIIPGAAILHTLMEEIGIGEIHVSRRSLRNGLLQDYLLRGKFGYLEKEAQLSVREQSVLQLGRSCGFNETHARHISELALDIFDSAGECGMHLLSGTMRELLKYAALLHDVGMFLSFSNHHAHTYYIIRNAELLGFNNSEIALMASTAFYHSKKYPRKKHPEFASLDSDSQKAVRVLSMFLSIAESLDRTHHQLVKGAYFTMDQGIPLLVIKAVEGSEIELWALEAHQKYFNKIFGKNFNTRVEFVCEQKNLDLEAG